jgi:hypothetical protein
VIIARPKLPIAASRIALGSAETDSRLRLTTDY